MGKFSVVTCVLTLALSGAAWAGPIDPATVPGPLDLDLSSSMENWIVNTSAASVWMSRCTITSENGRLDPDEWDLSGTRVEAQSLSSMTVSFVSSIEFEPYERLPIGSVSFAWNDPDYTFTYYMEDFTLYEGDVMIWIPEPTTFALLTLGVFGLVRRNRR